MKNIKKDFFKSQKNFKEKYKEYNKKCFQKIKIKIDKKQ